MYNEDLLQIRNEQIDYSGYSDLTLEDCIQL